MTHENYMAAVTRADARMKKSNGHSYLTILKTRCQYCHRSPKQKGQCPAWINRFVECLYEELEQSA